MSRRPLLSCLLLMLILGACAGAEILLKPLAPDSAAKPERFIIDLADGKVLQLATEIIRSLPDLQDSEEKLAQIAWLRALSMHLNRDEVSELLKFLAKGHRLESSLSPLDRFALARLVIELSWTAGQSDYPDSLLMELARAEGFVTEWWCDLPYSVDEEQILPCPVQESDQIRVPCPAGRLELGNFYIERQGKPTLIQAGARFAIGERTPVTLLVRTNSKVRFLLDSTVVESSEDGSLGIRPTATTVSPFQQTPTLSWSFSLELGVLAEGLHELVFAADAMPGQFLEVAVYSDGKPLNLETSVSRVPEVVTTERLTPSYPACSSQLLDLLCGVPQPSPVPTGTLRELLAHESLSWLIMHWLVAYGAQWDTVKGWFARSMKLPPSPAVADWLARFSSGHDDTLSKEYDARFIEIGRTFASLWLRRSYDRSQTPELRKRQLEAAALQFGWGRDLLLEYTALSPTQEEFRSQEIEEHLMAQLMPVQGLEKLMSRSSLLKPEVRLGLLRSLGPRSLPTLVFQRHLLETLVDAGMPQEALKQAEEAASQFPWVADVRARLGAMRMLHGDNHGAASAFATAMALDPADSKLKELHEQAVQKRDEPPPLISNPDVLARLLAKAEGLAAPSGAVQLLRSYELQLGATGELSGVVRSIVLFTRENRTPPAPFFYTDWGTWRVERTGLAEWQHSLKEGAILRRSGSESVSEGTVVESTVYIRRSASSGYSPGSFDILPVAFLDTPTVELSYRVSFTGTVPNYWCSYGIATKLEGNQLEFSNTQPLIFNDRPSPPLPAIAWSTVSENDVRASVTSWLGMASLSFHDIKDHLPKGKEGLDAFRSFWNATRLKLKMADRSWLDPSEGDTAKRVFSRRTADPFQFAFLALRAAKELGLTEKVKVSVGITHSLYPFEVPPADSGVLVPSLFDDVIFQWEEHKRPMIARASSPLPLLPPSGHFLPRAQLLQLGASTPPIESEEGQFEAPSSEYSISISGAKSGAAYARINTVLRGQPAEDALRIAGDRDTDAQQLFARTLTSWIGPIMKGSVADEAALRCSSSSRSLHFAVDSLQFDLSALPAERRRFGLLPGRPVLASLIKQETAEGIQFWPAWHGMLKIEMELAGMLKFSRQLQSAEHSAGEGLARLTVVSSTGENSEKLAIELVVQEHPIHADSQNSILALLKAAEEAFSVEIVWKH